MRFNLIALILFYFSGILVMSGHGADDRELRLSWIRLGPDPGPLYLMTSNGYVAIVLPSRHTSKPVSLRTQPPLVLYSRIELEDGGAHYTPVLSIDLPTSGNQWLILIQAQTGANGMELLGYPLPSNIEDFPLGTLRFINLCETVQFGLVGKNLMRINPGESQIFQAASNNHGPFPVRFAQLEPHTDQPQQWYSHEWRNHAEQRQLILILPGGGRIPLLRNFPLRL